MGWPQGWTAVHRLWPWRPQFACPPLPPLDPALERRRTQYRQEIVFMLTLNGAQCSKFARRAETKLCRFVEAYITQRAMVCTYWRQQRLSRLY